MAIDTLPWGDQTRPPSRRAVLTGGAAILATAAVPIAANAAAPNPDAALIAACAEFDRLEHAKRALLQGPQRIQDDETHNRLAMPLYWQQDELSKQIMATPATTIEGLRAKARSVVLYDAECAKGWDDLHLDMAHSIIRDLIGGAV